MSFGRAHYATCGRRATGGWATEDALFAVVARYKDIDGEEFEVTFLGHEAQHLADKRRFPGMEPWELEYRAKLTELALARATRARVLEKFTESQGEDRSSPHAYANKRVLEALRVELGRGDKDATSDLNSVPIDALQAAAKGALLADSRRREAARATTLR